MIPNIYKNIGGKIKGHFTNKKVHENLFIKQTKKGHGNSFEDGVPDEYPI